MGKHSRPDWVPVPKVSAAGVGGLVAAAVIAIANLADVFELPPGVAGLITAAAAFASGYVKRDRTQA